MKTFKEFIFECYYILEQKCFIEDSFLFEGRYKQESAFIRLFRQARGSKDWSKAAKLMDQGKEKEALELMQKVAVSLKKRISDARNNSSSPLNYGRSNPKEYVKGKTSESEESFYDNLDAVADAVAHAPLEKKFRSAVTSKVFLGRQLFGTGTDIGRLTQLAQDAGITSQTSTADFRLSSLRDSTKGSVGGSLKGGPAQIATAEPGDFRAAVQYAAQVYAEKEVPETEKNYEKKRQEIIDRLVSSGNEIAAQGESQRIPKDRKSENKPKVARAQSVLDTMYADHPGFDSILSKTFASGSHRFQEPGTKPDPNKDIPGTASIMVHTPEPGQKGREFAIEPISQTEPVQGRAAQGRGASNPTKGPRIQRPGTVRFDVNAPPEGAGTLSKFRRRVSAAQHAQTTAELEQQAKQADANLSAARAEVDKANDPSELRYVDGTEPLIQNRKRFQDFIGRHSTDPTVQHIVQARTMAQDNLTSAQSVANDATTSYQTHISTPPTVQPTQPEQPQQPAQTPPQQPVQQKPAPEQPPAPQPAPEQPPAPQPAPEQPPAPQPKKKKEEKKPPVEIAPEQAQ